MQSLTQVNKKLKISMSNLKKLIGNCDAVRADTVFYPATRVYQFLAKELVGLEHIYFHANQTRTNEQLKMIEQTVLLAGTTLDNIDEALNLAIDEYNLK
jgi:hypothetical protein